METSENLSQAALELVYHGLVEIVIAIAYKSTQPK